MKFDRKHYSDDILRDLYHALVKPRLIEEKMLILLRQNRVSKWFSGIGQEAIAVGATAALESDEYVLPLHRNLGVFTVRNCPLPKLFAQWQGKKDGYTKGRDRSFHFGTHNEYIIGMISHLGPQLAVADGIALADKLAGNPKVTLVFSGDGGASEGDFHEALNVAAVWDLPVIFLVENNGYGLSTPNNEQFRCRSFIDKGIGYGMDAFQVDGNNVLEVYDMVQQLSRNLRKRPRPILLEALTFRMRGHEEASGTKYVPQELFEEWGKKDPVLNYEKYLLEQNILTIDQIEKVRQDIRQEIEQALSVVFDLPEVVVDTEEELADMYYSPVTSGSPSNENPSTGERSIRFIDAISESLRQSMEQFPELVLMGQDIADYGGVFKITDGFVSKFGKERVRNTPLCESAILGASLGLSIKGYKAMVEMQFADFVTSGFNQIVNNLAKSHYRWGQNADVVVRMPTGANTAAGPFHSQSNEAWFFHTPGLKVVYPSNPYDAKGLLNAALADPNPYLYFEHKYLYRSISGPVPEEYYTVPIGKAALVSEGEDLTIVTYGLCVHWAKEIIAELGKAVSVDIIDLRTLLPWDKEAVAKSVQKTGRVLVVHEDTLSGGIGAEIAAWIGENCFMYLDAPVMREGSLDTAVPFSPVLEKNFLPRKRMEEKIKKLLAY
ncbi:dehydrogenase E1 component subunit alpha/beta [Cytophagaceae bacterium YF14B1]|uniref:Dehydrogenase E1 component subunit alpha/beta n=1 Tax=Xanthocytophaga flava TaxID=3048013 RepID=A0AAE3QQS6_9BACT|nr:dehydrogenase E1 component subunit alpha/beta [Xanthocytophaga flavus]MDJ1481164.1 dehydrogenase E1 component subunit alpha/beta [Xanthocytophaga flavus]